ncbi:MAG TPA: PH domain-containing protein [Xanthomonadaceae bacterium]|nr:PH domain-containing protein [Xanthomonadaceae bacterium]
MKMQAGPAMREFQLAPLQRMAWGLLLALWVALMAAAFMQPHQQPAGNQVPWWLVVPFATALVVVGPFILLQHRHIRLEGRTLVVAAALHTRRVALEDLLLEQARIVSLDEHLEFKPKWQLFGIRLPGFTAGHYLLRDRRRAFCLLTDRQRVLLLPQRDGRLLLLSPQKPQDLLDALSASARHR